MRVTAGFTQDMSWQPMGLLGIPDPVFYATMDDDFMFYQAGRYTITANTNGAVTAANADGGQVVLTTNSSTPLATDITSMQVNNANIVLPTPTQTNKLAFGCRIETSDATNAAINVGLIQKTTTPFTVTDGIYFSKASGSTTININVVSGSTVQATAALNGVFTPTNNSFFDLAFELDGKGSLMVFIGQNLYGQKQNQDTAPLGPMARVDVSSLTLSTAVLTPTLAVQSGTASSKTMNVDFVYAMKER
jgi:hypothetical protein